jgi:hypothetical protein
MLINFDLKLNCKTKFERMDLPNLAQDKNLVPNNIKIFHIDDNKKLSSANDIHFKFYVDNQDLIDCNRAYFNLMENFISLEDYKSYLSKGKTCQIWMSSSSDVIKNYRIIVEYVENNGYIFYQAVLEKTDKLFHEITERGHCTQLILSFNKPVKNLKMLSLINISEDIDDWFYSFDISDDSENIYCIDFTKMNKVYIKFLKFMKLVFEEVVQTDDKDEDQLKIFVICYGYDRSISN